MLSVHEICSAAREACSAHTTGNTVAASQEQDDTAIVACPTLPPPCDLCEEEKSDPIPHLKKLGRVELSLQSSVCKEIDMRQRCGTD